MLKDRKVVKIRKVRVNTESGRKWSVKRTVEEAESRSRHVEIDNSTSVAVERQGLGVTSTTRLKKQHLRRNEGSWYRRNEGA